MIGEVLELADRRDLESRAERREGSNPSFPTKIESPGSPRHFSILSWCIYVNLSHDIMAINQNFK